MEDLGQHDSASQLHLLHFPVLPLFFFEFLVFFPCKEFLFFENLGYRWGKTLLVFLVVFLAIKKGKEGQGSENLRRLWLKFFAGRVFRQEAAGKFIPDFPAKVWALSGKEIGCWKIGPTFGNTPAFSPP